MALAGLGNRTTATANAAAALEVIAGANDSYRLMELGFTLVTATASAFGFGRPAAIGITPTSPITVLTEDGNNASTFVTTTALAWGTGPTVPANFDRRISLQASIGAGIVWTWPRGFTVTKALTSVLWNPSGGS